MTPMHERSCNAASYKSSWEGWQLMRLSVCLSVLSAMHV